MNISFDFQVVCGDCGSLGIRIENPESASRDAIVYCGDCGGPRGTVGALRDLAVRPDAQVLPARQRTPKIKSGSELVAMHNELQSLRRKVQIAEASWLRKQADLFGSKNPGKDEGW
jgi:hypothetical protein